MAGWEFPENTVLCILTFALLLVAILALVVALLAVHVAILVLPAESRSQLWSISKWFPSPPSPPSPPPVLFARNSPELLALVRAGDGAKGVLDLCEGDNGFFANHRSFATEVREGVKALVESCDDTKKLVEVVTKLLERGVGPEERPYLEEVIQSCKAGLESLEKTRRVLKKGVPRLARGVGRLEESRGPFTRRAVRFPRRRANATAGRQSSGLDS